MSKMKTNTDVNLPIEVVPNTSPPRFKWRTTVPTMDGTGHTVQDCEGMLPTSIERAVVDLIGIARQALMECASLRGQIAGMMGKREERIAEVPIPPPPPPHTSPQPTTTTQSIKRK